MIVYFVYNCLVLLSKGIHLGLHLFIILDAFEVLVLVVVYKHAYSFHFRAGLELGCFH